MIQEQFPVRTEYRIPRDEWQGNQDNSVCFALTTTLEAVALHTGLSLELSSRFLWWYTDKNDVGISSVVSTLNRTSVCSEHLYPYVLGDLHIAPDSEALLDSLLRKVYVQVKQVSTKTEIIRALCKGSRLVTSRTYSNGNQYFESGLNFDLEKGVQLWGSVGSLYWEPWESFIDGTIDEVWCITKCPWTMIKHYGYTPESLPEFDGMTLSIPTVCVSKDWNLEKYYVKNVVLKFTDFGEAQENDQRVTGNEVVYFEKTGSIHLPVVYFNNKRYEKLSFSKPTVELLSIELT